MASSYLQPHNYQVSNRERFKLPYESALQEMATKNEYFRMGVAQLQQSRNNILNLNPQFRENKAYLNAFMDKANKDVQAAVKSDLSIQDNAASSAKIYDAIFDTSNKNNELLLKDDQINKWYQEQEKLSNTARTSVSKKGVQGENWNEANDFYFRQAYNKYLTDAQTGDLSKIDDNFQSRKGYVPYYDYSDEVNEVIKNCKPDSTQTTGVSDNYLYLNTKTSKGVSAEKMQNCMGFISDRAKQQIGIEAFRNFYNNKAGLLDQYRDIYIEKSVNQSGILASKIAIAKKAGDNGLATQLQGELDSIQFDLNKSMKMMEDPNFINNNYEDIASRVGFLQWAQRAGQSFSYNDVSNKLSPNAAGIAMFKAQQDERMAGIDFNNDMRILDQRFQQNSALRQQDFGYDVQLEQMKQEYDLRKVGLKLSADGSVVGAGGGTTPLDLNFDVVNSTGTFVEDQAAAQQGLNESIKGLSSAFIEYLSSPNVPQELRNTIRKQLAGSNGTAALMNIVQTYDESGQNDPVMRSAISKFRKANLKFNTLNDQRGSVDAQLKGQEPPNEVHNFSLTKVGTGQIPVSFSDRDLVDIYNGKTIRGWTYNKAPFGDNLVSPDGQRIFINTEDQFIRAMDRANLNMEEYMDKRMKLLNENYKSSERWFTGPEISKEQYDNRDRKVRQILALPEDIEVIQSVQNRNGESRVKLGRKGSTSTDGSNAIRDLTPEELAQFGLTANKGYVTVPSLYNALPEYINTENNEAIVAYTDRMLRSLKNNEWAEPRQFTNASGLTFNVKMGKVGDEPIYKVSIYRPKLGWVEANETYQNREHLLHFIENTRR